MQTKDSTEFPPPLQGGAGGGSEQEETPEELTEDEQKEAEIYDFFWDEDFYQF